jgi:ethanolamine permease
MQMAAYLKIKSFDSLERPYTSPLGRGGAIVAGTIAAFTLVFLFINPDYRPGIYGVALWYAISVGYFAFYARHRMILSPEEEFAESAGRD